MVHKQQRRPTTTTTAWGSNYCPKPAFQIFLGFRKLKQQWWQRRQSSLHTPASLDISFFAPPRHHHWSGLQLTTQQTIVSRLYNNPVRIVPSQIREFGKTRKGGTSLGTFWSLKKSFTIHQSHKTRRRKQLPHARWICLFLSCFLSFFPSLPKSKTLCKLLTTRTGKEESS